MFSSINTINKYPEIFFNNKTNKMNCTYPNERTQTENGAFHFVYNAKL